MAILGWGIPGRSATRSPTQLPHARTVAKALLKDLQPLADDKSLLCGWDGRWVRFLQIPPSSLRSDRTPPQGKPLG